MAVGNRDFQDRSAPTLETLLRLPEGDARREAFFHCKLIEEKISGKNKVAPTTLKGNRNLRDLLHTYGTLEKIFRITYGTSFLVDYSSLDHKRAEEILKYSAEFNIVRDNGKDPFPAELARHDSHAPVLYYRGDLSLADRKSIAFVGTRKLSDPKDIDLAEHIIERLVKTDYVVVSGLAYGSDELGHRHTVRVGGKTIAVLGTPLHKSNKDTRKLQEEIATKHLLVSQYPIGMNTFPSHFQFRNATTVGLSSDGIIVVRASDKSGTLGAITACDKQGKKLYVLESAINIDEYKWQKKYQEKIIILRWKEE